MSDSPFPLGGSPIIEAVLDIDCDMPTTLDRQALKAAATEALADRYPEVREQFLQQHVIRTGPGGAADPEVTRGPGPLQFLSADGRQLVQFRPNGYSFNRLAPYVSLDDYLPEIEATWKTFVELAKPEQVRKIGLRMINRILLPMSGGGLDFGEWLAVPPRLPTVEGSQLAILSFLEQQLAVDHLTGQQFNLLKTSQAPEGENLPVILDIDAFHDAPEPVPEWPTLLERIQSLRNLKNQVFESSLTPQCLQLFSPQS